MSFYVATATRDLALVAADTRLRYPGLGDLIDDHPKRRKLRQIGRGWATGSSVCAAWLDLVYAVLEPVDLADSNAVAVAVRGVRESEAFRALSMCGGWAEAMATRPAVAVAEDAVGDVAVVAEAKGYQDLLARDEITRTELGKLAKEKGLSTGRGQRDDRPAELAAAAAGPGFFLTAITDDGTVTRAQPGQFAFNTLEEIERSALSALVAGLGGFAVTECDLFRKAGALFADIYARCGPNGSVGPLVEVAMMTREDGHVVHRHVGPRLSAELARADVATIMPWIEVTHA